MNFLPRSRALIAGTILLPVLLLVALLYIRSRPATIGDFTLPTLSGWKQSVFKAEHSQRVIYTKLGNDHTSRISFAWQSSRSANPPKNTQDLQNEVAQGMQIVNRMQKSFGSKSQWNTPSPLLLNGMTAVESQRVSTSPYGVTHTKAINFINGRNYYILNSSISTGSPSAAITPEAQAELDVAFETVTKSLTPSSQ